ncbi:MAG: LemA family protein [Patescibacteria group bacterium]
MVILYVTLIVVALCLAICFVILRYRSVEVRRRKDKLREALWFRNHRIPLIIEMAERGGLKSEVSQKIIELRAAAANGAYSLAEQMELERKLTHLLFEFLKVTKATPGLKSDPLFLSLEQEHSKVLEHIRITLNDYNFALQQFHGYARLPWFAIFAFLFEIRRDRVLEPV